MSKPQPSLSPPTMKDGTNRYLATYRNHDTEVPAGARAKSLIGVANPDFLAVGLGGTNMLAMLWTIAMGKRAVGVEIRGDPILGVHWNIREDMYHQLGLIDQMMQERYGKSNLPRQLDGKLMSLADIFYHKDHFSRDIIPDASIDGQDPDHHLTGRILNVEYIDDRWKNGSPHRTVTIAPPPTVPEQPCSSKIRTNMQDVLDGPSTWQSGALTIQLLLRRYLEALEDIDLKAGHTPRVRLFTKHRVVEDGSGYMRLPCGNIQIRIEEVTEVNYAGTLVRIRTPGSDFINIGKPELFSIATGVGSKDAESLGFEQHDVYVDHGDGAGEKVAQADFLAAQIDILVDGRLRRRIASEFDEHGNEFWVRQIAVGHENDPRIGWVIVEVPSFKSFCPIERGLVKPNVTKDSPEYFAAYQILVYDYYVEQVSLILEMEPHVVRRATIYYGPKPFSLVERIGDDAKVAVNGVIAGDSFGNGHFLHSAGAMCGMLGHAYRFLEYWQRREAGHCAHSSIRILADRIKADTETLLQISAKEFSQAIPQNFGADRGKRVAAASGISSEKRATIGEAGGQRKRFEQSVLDPTDWRRLFIRNGKVNSAELPKISNVHPALRVKKIEARL